MTLCSIHPLVSISFVRETALMVFGMQLHWVNGRVQTSSFEGLTYQSMWWTSICSCFRREPIFVLDVDEGISYHRLQASLRLFSRNRRPGIISRVWVLRRKLLH